MTFQFACRKLQRSKDIGPAGPNPASLHAVGREPVGREPVLFFCKWCFMFVLYAIRSTLSAIRDKCIILHHKSQGFDHFGVLMTNKHLFTRLLKKANNHSSLILNHLYGLHNFAFYILIFDFSLQPLPPNVIVHKYLRAEKLLYNCRETSTNIESSLQIKLFMQNKANFRKVKLNVTNVLTKDYEQMDTWSIRKKQSQTKPNKAKTNPNSKRPK
jgi:hypothetical protein